MGNPSHALGICDRCGFERRLNDLRKEWTGHKVCFDTCWEPRHPQDFVRGRADDQTLHEPRPEPADVYVLVDLLIKEDGGLLLLEAGDADIGGNPPSLALET